MAVIHSRLPSLTEWHYDVIGSGRIARTFVSLCAWLWRRYSCPTQCHVVISSSSSFAATNAPIAMLILRLSSLNGWHYDVVGSGRTVRTFVLVCAWRWRCYSCSTECDVTTSSSFPVTNAPIAMLILRLSSLLSKYTKMTEIGSCLSSLTGCNDVVGSALTARTFASLCVWLWRRYSCLKQCDATLSFNFIVKNTTMAVIHSRLPSLNGCNDAVGSGRTGREFVSVCAWLWNCC